MSYALSLSAEPTCVVDLAPGLSSTAQSLERLALRSQRGETVRIVPPPFDALSDGAARAVMARWTRPCEGAFELLAAHFPRDLAKLIERDRLAPSDLTFAAEALGRSSQGWLVRAVLPPLLRHSSAVVREGAIYGLQRHLDAEIRGLLLAVSKTDPSAAVRTAAEDALSEP